jgi:hypothetical protein
VFFHQSGQTIDKTVKLNILSGFLESQETVNNVVTTRGLLTKENNSDSEFLGLIRDKGLKILVKLLQNWIIEMHVIIN